MDAMSKAFGARFTMFLQPTVYHKNELTEQEITLVAKYQKNRLKLDKETTDYFRQFSISKADYSRIDLSNMFRFSRKDLFIDPCHWNDVACQLIAEAVYDAVAKTMFK